MATTIEEVLEILREDFPGSTVTYVADGSGGGAAIVDPVDLGPGYAPRESWVGAQLTPALPFADIYPVFIDGAVTRTDGKEHQAPITKGQTFAGRSAVQISLRTNNLMSTVEAAASKFTKVVHFIREAAK